jgi:hypothetical protein
MKKILLVVAILLIANPTWAGLTITAEQTDDCNEVTISYDMEDTDPNLPRAFALEISLSQENDANIGPVTTVHPEFHVYPGSIVITGGVVTDQGTPVAESDANSIIVEMGSLYAAEDPCHTSPPAENGILLVFMVQNNVDCHVNLAQNAIRGGVVMEDTSQEFDPGYVTLVECDVVASNCPGAGCKGDVSGDNQVSIADLSAVVSMLAPAYAGTTPPYTVCPPPPGYAQGDVTGDNCVSIADLSAIVSYLAPAYAGTTPPYTGPCMP